MSSRVRNLCQSLLPREGKRVDLFFIRAATIAGVLAITMIWRFAAVSSGFPAVWGGPAVGRFGLEVLLIIQALVGLGLAIRLAGDAVGDRKSGLLELLSLSGCTPREWLATRLLTILPAVATTWTIPIPFFFLVFSFGGVGWRNIVLAEILLFCQMTMLIGVGMVIAHSAPARSALRSLPSLIVALEVGQSVPSMLTTFLASIGWVVPAWLVDTFLFLSRATTRWSVLAALKGDVTGPQFAAACLIPLAIAGGAVWVWLRGLYADPSDERVSLATASGRLIRKLIGNPRDKSVESDGASTELATAPVVSQASAIAAPAKTPVTAARRAVATTATRASRRSWDDALAWQAYAVFNRGAKGTIERSLLYGCIGLVLIPVVLMDLRPWAGFAMAGLLIACIASLFWGMSRASECLQQEIKESTLSTLMLTPHEPAELHDGWSRGTLRLLWPELDLLAITFLVTMWRDSGTLAPCTASVSFGVLSLGPFLTLSPLLPYTFAGVGTGLLVFAAGGMIATIGIVVGVYVHPWAAPFVVAPLVYGWNRLCRSLVASWLMNKVRALT